MVSCILLSGGESRRFGSPKALAVLNGEIIISKSLKMLISSQLFEIIVVLGAHKTEIKPLVLKHKKVKAVYNKNFKFGQTSSFQTGVKAASEKSSGYMLLPVDFPNVEVEIIDALIRRFEKTHPFALIPTFNHLKGHPPIFSSNLKNEILGLDLKLGINTLFINHSENVDLYPVDNRCILQTFNTPDELENLSR